MRVNLYTNPEGEPYRIDVPLIEAFPEASERNAARRALASQGQYWCSPKAAPAIFAARAQTAPGIGRLWWIADNEAELKEWCQTYVARGAVIEDVEPHQDGTSLLNVTLALPKDRAKEILGYEPDDEEWLED
jgi:hypothetical protein